MKPRKPKTIDSHRKAKAEEISAYTLSAAERAPIDADILRAEQLRQEQAGVENHAQGCIAAIMSIHGLAGDWEYDRVAGKLTRKPKTPATPAGETK